MLPLHKSEDGEELECEKARKKLFSFSKIYLQNAFIISFKFSIGTINYFVDIKILILHGIYIDSNRQIKSIW